MHAFTLTPLPAPLPTPSDDEIRRIVVDEEHSYPCRRCLRDAEIGDGVLLLSYDPFADGAESPYRQPGPIYVHERDCAYEPNGELPDQLRRRLLSVRSFDAGHLMLGGEVVDGSELEATLERLLGEDDVSYVHVHNAGPGCFAVRIDRDA